MRPSGTVIIMVPTTGEILAMALRRTGRRGQPGLANRKPCGDLVL